MCDVIIDWQVNGWINQQSTLCLNMISYETVRLWFGDSVSHCSLCHTKGLNTPCDQLQGRLEATVLKVEM